MATLTFTPTLTSVFREAVTDTAWRWPALVVAVVLLVHLFMPPALRRYDPFDRLYRRANREEGARQGGPLKGVEATPDPLAVVPTDHQSQPEKTEVRP